MYTCLTCSYRPEQTTLHVYLDVYADSEVKRLELPPDPVHKPRWWIYSCPMRLNGQICSRHPYFLIQQSTPPHECFSNSLWNMSGEAGSFMRPLRHTVFGQLMKHKLLSLSILHGQTQSWHRPLVVFSQAPTVWLKKKNTSEIQIVVTQAVLCRKGVMNDIKYLLGVINTTICLRRELWGCGMLCWVFFLYLII